MRLGRDTAFGEDVDHASKPGASSTGHASTKRMKSQLQTIKQTPEAVRDDLLHRIDRHIEALNPSKDKQKIAVLSSAKQLLLGEITAAAFAQVLSRSPKFSEREAMIPLPGKISTTKRFVQLAIMHQNSTKDIEAVDKKIRNIDMDIAKKRNAIQQTQEKIRAIDRKGLDHAPLDRKLKRQQEQEKALVKDREAHIASRTQMRACSSKEDLQKSILGQIADLTEKSDDFLSFLFSGRKQKMYDKIAVLQVTLECLEGKKTIQDLETACKERPDYAKAFRTSETASLVNKVNAFAEQNPHLCVTPSTDKPQST